jgi:hypothetical protein
MTDDKHPEPVEGCGSRKAVILRQAQDDFRDTSRRAE